MRYLLVIILIIGILTSSLNKLIVYTYYQLNTEQITLKYCENKSKPSLKCNGKCHLKKQIKELEKKEDQSKSNVKNDNEIQLFSSDFDLGINEPYISKVSSNTFYVVGKIHELSFSVFHPPTC